MVIVRGLCLVITKGTPLSLFTLPPEFKAIGQGEFYGIPYVIIIFLVVIVASSTSCCAAPRRSARCSTPARNEKAALYSGIKTNQVKFWVTVLCSTLAGLAGVIYMARFGAATPTFGVGMELNIIAAAVIGGASLNGGSGTIFGAILGMALLSVVTSSLILLDVSRLLAGHDQGLHSARGRLDRPFPAQAASPDSWRRKSHPWLATTRDDIADCPPDAPGAGPALSSKARPRRRSPTVLGISPCHRQPADQARPRSWGLSRSRSSRRSSHLVEHGGAAGGARRHQPRRRRADGVENPQTALQSVGEAAARLLLETDQPMATRICITGGKGVSAVVAGLQAARRCDVEVVPATGLVQGKHYTDVNHVGDADGRQARRPRLPDPRAALCRRSRPSARC